MLTILIGDVIEQLAMIPDRSVQCCVSSPPYWGLRDYGVAGQIGLEKTPEQYVEKMVAVFRQVRRVLRDDGTIWVNLGDCYNAYNGGSGTTSKIDHPLNERNLQKPNVESGYGLRCKGLKPKDLVGIPWRVAFALQADGWYLRSDIIWSKPNPMPESVTDRPTKAHEYIFLLSKNERYFFDQDAVKEPAVADHLAGNRSHKGIAAYNGGATEHRTKVGLVEYARKTAALAANDGPRRMVENVERARAGGAPHDNPFGFTRNIRTVWEITTQPFPEAHFATFPEELPKRCILAGSRASDTVLDPFGGSGTTAKVALELGRQAIVIELNPEYGKMIDRRCQTTIGLGF